MAESLQEYVIKLSTQIDNQGVQQILSLLDSGKLKALGLTAALGAATTAIYKFVESTIKQEYELEALAKKQNKHIENVRAEQQALKSMGKTLNEIKKDAALEKTYKDLVKFNKEMEMPNAERAIGKVKELQGAFWRMHSAINYVVDAIGRQLLINLEAPIERITKRFGSVADWLQKNLTSVSNKITSYLTGFSKGVIGIAEGVGKIFEWVNQLPEGIKSIGAAITVVFGLLKSGPIGQILALVTMIGDIIHDYEVYQWDKSKGLNPGDKGYVKNLNDIWGIWDLFDVEGESAQEKFGKISVKILTWFTDALNRAAESAEGQEGIGRLLGGENGEGGLIGSITKWFDENQHVVAAFGNAVLKFATNSIREAGGFTGEAFGQLVDALFGEGTVSTEIKSDDSAATAFAGGLIGFATGVVESMKKGGTLADAVKNGLKNGFIGELIGAITSNIEVTDQGVEIDWAGIIGDSEAVGLSFLGIVEASIGAVGDIGGKIMEMIGNALANTKIDFGSGEAPGFIAQIGNTIAKWGQNDTVSGTITTAVASWFASGGNFVDTAVGAIAGALTGSKEAVIKQLKQTGASRGVSEEILNSMSDETLVSSFGDGKTMFELMFGEIGPAAGQIVVGLWDAICSAIDGVSDIGGTLLTSLLSTIVKALGGQSDLTGFVSKELESLSDNGIVEGIATGIGTWIGTGNFFAGLVGGIVATVQEAQSQVDENNSLWDVLKKQAGELWEKIENIWYGPLLDENTGARDNKKGLVSVFQPLLDAIVKGWNSLFEEGGALNSLFANLGENVTTWLQPVGDAIVDFFDGVWIRIYNSGPEWLRQAFGFVGIQDPNKTEVTRDESGNIIASSTNEKKKTLSESELAYLSRYEEVDADGNGTGKYNFKIDEKGKLIGTGAYSGVDIQRQKYTEDYDEFSEMVADLMDYGEEDESTGILSSFYNDILAGKDIDTDAYEKAFSRLKKFHEKIVTNVPETAGATEANTAALEVVTPAQNATNSTAEATETGNVAATEDNTAALNSVSESLNSFVEFTYNKLPGWLFRTTLNEDGTPNFSNMEQQMNDGHWAPSFSNVLKNGIESEYKKGNIKELTLPIKPKVNTAAIQTQIDSGNYHADVELDTINTSGENDGTELPRNNAMGGRYEKPTKARLGEAGAEYVIPISKPGQGISLIAQALSEMGSNAINEIANRFGFGDSLSRQVYNAASGFSGMVSDDFSLGTAGTIGESFANMESAMQGMQNATYNINAPVNIYVQATGAGADEIGASVYNAAERQLLKTLRGAWA